MRRLVLAGILVGAAAVAAAQGHDGEGGKGSRGLRGSRAHSISGVVSQVVFVLDPDDTVYVIHARPLTEAEKWRMRQG